ncbi:MAG: hypothetical protein HY866_09185 [Chloroflexi bacterium]|nr:hypothetical protein [Chloroflexota bacterium]
MNHNTLKRGIGVLCAVILLAAGCAQNKSPQDAVETFLKAMLAGDQDKAFGVVCPDWEAQAAVELDAFSGVSGKLEGMECKQAGEEDGYTLVTCKGKMVLDYRGEERERSLEETRYLTQKLDGEWKVCGYQ